MIPLTAEVLFSLYGRYNLSLGLLPAIGYGLCLVALLAAMRPFPASDRGISAVLAAFWILSGAAFHFGFLAPLTWAAWIFGAVFILAGVLFLWTGVVRERLRFRWEAGPRGAAALVLFAFALAYPALDLIAGHRWPQLQLPGSLPAPTVLATFALLLMTQGRSGIWLAVIPLLWALLHGAAALFLGIWQDTAMATAAFGAFGLLLFPSRRRG